MARVRWEEARERTGRQGGEEARERDEETGMEGRRPGRETGREEEDRKAQMVKGGREKRKMHTDNGEKIDDRVKEEAWRMRRREMVEKLTKGGKEADR